MTDEDIFFTHTVVAQAMSIEMGRPMDRKSAVAESPESQIGFVGGHLSLPQVWKEWCLIQGAYPYAGLPRRRPGHIRRWLERHALILASISLLMLLLTAGFVVALIWFPDRLALPGLSLVPSIRSEL